MAKSNSLVKSKVCPKCGFDMHQNEGAFECEICSTPLIPKEFLVKKVSDIKGDLPGKKDNDAAPKKLFHSFSWVKLQRLLLEYNGNKIYLPLIGLVVLLTSATVFTTSIIANNSSRIDKSKEIEISGLANYGGDSTFAPLVAEGLNKYVESKYPNLKLRYTKPVNNDFSSVNGIEMLLNGELSFAYSARPLSDEEYRNAQIRGFKLKQIAIAVDGISVFSNFWTPTSKLNFEQVEKIFSGEIDNWNQIDPRYESLPIVPIAVNNEDYGNLNLKESSTTIKLPTYTDVMQKVISTPGAISLASSSLVQNQRSLKIYSLANENTSNYINLFSNKKLNIAAIKEGSYPLTRRLFVVYREDGSNDQITGETIANLLTSSEGQEIINNSNYVPIY
jgi:phosphate transport system substrate-binding protein